MWLAITSLLGEAGYAQDTINQTGTQWYPYLAWNLPNPDWTGNPFDIQAHARFVHSESGDTMLVPMFYAEDDVWKFRFTAISPGTWRFSTHSNSVSLNGYTGAAIITPNDDPAAQGVMKAFGA